MAVAVTVLAAASIARSVARRSRRESLRDKTVLVSGGARGLGLQIAREAAARGARLALLARSNVELEAARSELRGGGAMVEIAVCDVRDDA
ncbi:MAG: SDR family NAD(P)-dependent oxidoreductase, partial [Candidatus Eremiobacteraeota bacterium]|nr:SDR family NAD(P)-dependent oxidoreductase [Candidatus Eremiobacteraeota bacterium]